MQITENKTTNTASKCQRNIIPHNIKAIGYISSSKHWLNRRNNARTLWRVKTELYIATDTSDVVYGRSYD